MLAELYNKGGSFCEQANAGVIRCPLLVRSTSEDVITGELVQTLRMLNPRWWLHSLLNTALGTDRFHPKVYRRFRIEPWVNHKPYPKELLPWAEGSTQVDIEISWENPPTTVLIEAKYQSELSKKTSNSHEQDEYPTDQLIRNIRVGLHHCGYFQSNGLFEMPPRNLVVILLRPNLSSQLVSCYRSTDKLLESIPCAERLKRLPPTPFVGELGYEQINHVLGKSIRYFTRAEKELVWQLKNYLDFKRGTMRTKIRPLTDLTQQKIVDDWTGIRRT